MNKHADVHETDGRRRQAAARARRARQADASTSRCRAAARTAPSPGACSTGCSRRTKLSFDGVVATSAGAMNAAVLAYGLAEGGRRGAQTALANFWRRVSHASAFSPLQPSLLDRADRLALARVFAGLHDVRHGDAADVALPVQSAQLQSAARACWSSRSTSTRSAWRAVR